MRVRQHPDFASLARLAEVVSLDEPLSADDGEEMSLLDFIPAPEPADDPNDMVTGDLFTHLAPGRERTTAALLVEGYTHHTIGFLTGYTPSQIRATVTTIRGTVVDAQPRRRPAPYRAWDRRHFLLRAVYDLDDLHPKKQFRVMPWTGYVDALRRPIYLWDILRAHGQVKVVRRYFDTKRQTLGWTPFCGKDCDLWLADARVIGNVYQNPELVTEGGESFEELLR
jgi:hypothetical protein